MWYMFRREEWDSKKRKARAPDLLWGRYLEGDLKEPRLASHINSRVCANVLRW